MLMPMTPLQSWALILLMILTVVLIVVTLADWLNPETDVNEDASHDEEEPEGPALLDEPHTETQLYDWAVDGL